MGDVLEFLPRCTLKTIPNVRCPSHSYFIIMFSSPDYFEDVHDDIKSLTQLTHVLINTVFEK